MHHLYPSCKGDALCPLGFHPQVRWPTRCKRCFRDYKEHGGRRGGKDDIAASSPSLSSWNSQPQIPIQTTDIFSKDKNKRKTWSSSTNLYDENKDVSYEKEKIGNILSMKNNVAENTKYPTNRTASWTSTPDLTEESHSSIPTFNIILPRKRVPAAEPVVTDTGQKSESKHVERRLEANKVEKTVKKVKKLKEVTPTESTDKNEKIIKIKEVKPTAEESKNHDVQFLIQVKSKTFNHSDNNDMNRSSLKQSAQNIEDDVFSTAGTETTDTTLVDRHELHDDELQEQIDSLKQELDTVKARCEKAEREKSDMLLRRLATYETVTSKTTASEVLKLQQKCNELQTQLEDVKDDKKSLSLRVKELESDIENRPNPQDVQKVVEELKSKLMAAEQLCEELMDENEDMKKEMRYLEEEMEEMQDNFREDQANEYTSLKKELEQTTKNCRILSFKLRKTERKVEQLETEKQDAEKKLKDISGGQTMLENIEKMKRLEQDLNIANEVAVRLQKEVDEVNLKLKKTAELEKDSTKPIKKAPSLGTLHNISSGDKISRASLTRGGSQDDPVQLLRDLQDCLEREADLREQLKFAEEEAENLRKKASRVEDDNESLVLQLKKMATKARGHKLNPSSNLRSLATESSLEKDEGISEDEDPSELRLLLELSEQEASVLRRKIEDMERDADTMKRKLKDTQSKLNAKSTLEKRNISVLNSVQDTKTTAVQEQKMKVLEDETVDLRKKLIEKERDCERLYAELSITQKKAKGMQRSKSLDGDQQTLDLRRQLQVVEQEAVVLQSKLQNLETENEKLSGENKRLLLLTNKGTKKSTSLVSKIKEEKTSSDITENNGEVSGIKVKASDEYKQLKQKFTKVENENEKLKQSISRMQTPAATLQTTRTPKTVTDLTPKSQLKNMVLELENEIGDILANLKTVEDAKANFEEELKQNKMLVQQNQESEKSSKEETEKQIKELEKKIAEQNVLITKEKSKFEDLNAKLTNEKNNIKKMEEEKKTLQKTIETTNTKLNEEQKKNLKTLSLKEKKIESLEKELEAVSKTVKEKSKVADQVLEKNKIIQEHEKRLLELTQKINNTESLLTTNKETISKLEKELESGKQTMKEKETEWLREKKELQNKLKQQSESKFEGSKTLDELEKNKLQLNELQNNLDTSLADKKALESKVQKLEDEFKNEKTVWEKKAADLESDLLAEKKKLERMKTKYEKQEKTQQELIKLKQKIQTLQNESNNDANKIANKELTNELEKMKKLYEDLTSKYEILEEEHVVTKSKLIMEKGEVMNQLDIYKTELINMKKERDNLHQKQKELQEEIKNIYKNTKQTQQTTELEKSRLKSAETRLEEKIQELDQNRKEIEVLEDQFQNLRKENEDLKQKLDDFHKVSKVQRNINADNSALEKELVQMRNKLLQTERSHKTDLGENKLYYESQINTINEELQSLQNQVLKFKRERDMFKHMLEGTQRALSELKNMSAKSGATISAHSDSEEVEETKLKIATLEQQTSCLEDELSEARLESTKLKTELVSERSSWEIKLQEMRSKINELEEDRLLSSGRTKIVGMRTRMELAWQKEREEQQRLLQETSTLARDLRQTLFEVERERDKERLEAKRKQEQLKKTAEEEQEENKKKLNELQCDLLELRDAHAKLRTTNEKLRREKEKTEREKDDLKSTLHSRKKTNEDDENHVRLLLQQVEKLLKMVPESQTSSRATTPTPPKRVRGSKSRESSPSLSGTPTIGRRSIEREIQYNIQKLKDAMQDIQGSQTKARPNIRRSTSHDAREKILKENTSGLTYRSLSLEPDNRNVTFLNDEPSIWGKPESDSTSLTSLQSLDKMSTDSDRYYAMDSRLSSGSTQSEIITGTDKKKKKKSLMGTLKKLTKTRSMDENSGPSFYKSSAGSDSSMTSKEDSGSKVDLKDRITGIFKRGGSSSRSSSLERIKPDTSSLQRPVKFSTQHKPSPSPSETSISLRGSSSSRYKQY